MRTARRGPQPDPHSAATRKGDNTLKYPTRLKAEPGRVLPPAHVRNNPRALAFWKKHADRLVADLRLQASQVEAFALLCVTHATILNLADQLAAEGYTITTSRGGVVAHPMAQIQAQQQRLFVTLSKEFGMTAASQSKIPLREASDGEEGKSQEALLRSFTG